MSIAKNLSLSIATLCSAFCLIQPLSAQDLGSMGGGAVKPKVAPAPACATAVPKEPGTWDLSSAVGFNLTSGNISSRLLTASFNAEREKDSDIYKFNVTGADGQQEGNRTQRFIKSTARYNRLLSDRLYAGVGGSFLKDDIADVDYRAVLNPGLGYYLVKSDDVEFALEGGPAYVWQKLGVKEDFLAARAADDFSWKLSETAKVFQNAEYLLDTDNTDLYIVNATVGLEASLTSTLALVTSVMDRYNSLPAAGREKNDIIVTSALKISF